MRRSGGDYAVRSLAPAPALPALLAGGPVLGKASTVAQPCAAGNAETPNTTVRESQRQAASGASPNALPAMVANQLPEATVGLHDADIVFPLVHGTYGEDGTLQGVLEFAGLPYVGAGVAASAVGMDKHLMRMVLRGAGLPVLDWLLVERHIWRCNGIRRASGGWSRSASATPASSSRPTWARASASTKSGRPTNSTPRWRTPAATIQGVWWNRRRRLAARNRMQCAGQPRPKASVPGEVVPAGEFYDYRSKYLDDRSALRIPAPLTPEQAERVRQLSVAAFRALDCAGMARVDFFLSDDTLWLNEINTIPGFTRISMYPKLWEASGVPYGALARPPDRPGHRAPRGTARAGDALRAGACRRGLASVSRPPVVLPAPVRAARLGIPALSLDRTAGYWDCLPGGPAVAHPVAGSGAKQRHGGRVGLCRQCSVR